MPSIVSYQKASDATTTYQLALPDGAIELCTLDGTTYVALPDGAKLPDQPKQIAASVKPVAMTAPLKEAIKAASPHCQLISERMQAKIRAKYPLEDELAYARIGIGAAHKLYAPTQEEFANIAAFGVFVDGVRQWGRDERAKLGL